MWTFSRILGAGLALAMAAPHAIWFEVTQSPLAPGLPQSGARRSFRP